MLIILQQTKSQRELFLPLGGQNGKSKYEFASQQVEKKNKLSIKISIWSSKSKYEYASLIFFFFFLYH